jgi:hypothetical protein
VQRVPFWNVMKVHFHEKKISPSAEAVNAGEAALRIVPSGCCKFHSREQIALATAPDELPPP